MGQCSALCLPRRAMSSVQRRRRRRRRHPAAVAAESVEGPSPVRRPKTRFPPGHGDGSSCFTRPTRVRDTEWVGRAGGRARAVRARAGLHAQTCERARAKRLQETQREGRQQKIKGRGVCCKGRRVGARRTCVRRALCAPPTSRVVLGASGSKRLIKWGLVSGTLARACVCSASVWVRACARALSGKEEKKRSCVVVGLSWFFRSRAGPP